MFTALHEIIKAGDSLTLEVSPGPSGTMKVIVKPALGKAKIPELAMPLMLCATPAELDAGFLDAVMRYQAPRLDLAAQVSSTTALLGQAKKDQATRAVKALQSTATASTATNLSSEGSDNEDDEEDNDSNPPPKAPQVANVSETSTAQSGTNLSTLLD
ncbi:PRTRC system protein E [Rugamonas sp. A1-17]|nr:PRTRC system protein E [Rugamonas sp. A1-17]